MSISPCTPRIGRWWFFIRRGLNDLRPLRYEISHDVTSSTLGEYYFCFEEAPLRNSRYRGFRIDNDGTPLIPTYIDVKDAGYYASPVSVGQYGLAIFGTYMRTGLDVDRDRFLRIADWYVNHQVRAASDHAVWHIPVEVPRYHIAPPWISAMGQGRALSILMRAYQLSGDERYAMLAKAALKPFTLKISEGGVCSVWNGCVFYEEYAVEPAPHVLNGMIFALFGLYDYVRATNGDPLAGELFHQGVRTLAEHIHAYDLGVWTRYDLYDLVRGKGLAPNPATAHYHDIHIKQLKVLHQITHLDVFEQCAHRWEAYQVRPWSLARAYLMKIRNLRQVAKSP